LSPQAILPVIQCATTKAREFRRQREWDAQNPQLFRQQVCSSGVTATQLPDKFDPTIWEPSCLGRN